jgi:hypothetical protein
MSIRLTALARLKAVDQPPRVPMQMTAVVKLRAVYCLCTICTAVQIERAMLLQSSMMK